MEKGMSTSPSSFKQALRIVFKRNIVRLALLFILLGVWWIVLMFRGESRYSVSPHTMVKAKFSRVESPTRVVLVLDEPNGKKYVQADLLAADARGFPESIGRSCEGNLKSRLEGQVVWVRSSYLTDAQQTVGKILVAQKAGPPQDIGVLQIQEGCAFYCGRDDQYLSSADRQLYVGAQNQAKESRSGIWAADVKPPAECESASK
jgi:hypothetical protein